MTSPGLPDFPFEDVGLAGLSDEEKQRFLAGLNEELVLRVGSRLNRGLSDSQIEEFTRLIDRDEEFVHAWLESNAGQYQDDPIYRHFASLGLARAEIEAEAAATIWLRSNCPDYRGIVQQTVREFYAECIQRLNGSDDPQ
ncbi:MAG: DUF5663 domain-containing protein [Propionibacterium sp.]|jgi:hypothetical protein|nr:DUF5663 domain-containing protein [Propionibacterium sp.]